MAVGQVRADDEIALPLDTQQAIGAAPGDLHIINVTERGTVEIRRFAPMRLAEDLGLYRIEGTIDEARDRELWQDVAARDVIETKFREGTVMNADPPSDAIVSMNGVKGETIFYVPMTPFVDAHAGSELQVEIDSLLPHTGEEHSDRLLAVLGALLVENAVDKILSSLLPGFKDMQDNRDFTFSMRIAILRALQVMPTRITLAADVIRQIRNDFAHDLGIDAFEKLRPGRNAAVRHRLEEFGTSKQDSRTSRVAFRNLVTYVVLGCWTYARHTEALNRYLRSDAFVPALRKWSIGQGT